MAQTTSGMAASDMSVWLSTDGSNYTDVSGFANSVEIDGGERETGEAYTFTGDTAIIKAGKRGPLTVTVRGIYTETASEYYDMVVDAYEGGSALYVRWSPGGGDSGDLGFTSQAGIVKNAPYPVGEANAPDPILAELVLECAYVTEAAIGTAGWS